MNEDPLQEVATRFAALWRVLSHEGEVPRPPDERQLLIDQVRAALDRRQEHLGTENASFIANSFLVEQQIHEGALTRIECVRHRDLQTLHALKSLHPDQGEDIVARDLLLREARFGLLLRHQHVAATQMALRLADGRPALVLEWLPFSLAARLETGSFSHEEIRDTLVAILAGLEVIHAAGLVHADIAPDNLLAADGSLAGLRIADFGIALESGGRHADLGLAKAGHTDFAAPEQQAGQRLDGRCDLYACGRIGLLMLARCAERGSIIERLADLARHLSEEDPGRRPENASAALRWLRDSV